MFSEMGPAELDRIAAATVPLYFDKGQSIVQCGDPCTGFHVVVYGHVKLAFTSPQGVEKWSRSCVQDRERGMCFSTNPTSCSRRRSSTRCCCTSPSTPCSKLGPDGFGRRMIAGLAQRLHGLVRDVEAYSLRSGQDRFIGYLLAELPEAASGPAECASPPASVLASRLNMTCRALLAHPARPRRARLIGERRSIRVPDVARLRGG